MAKITRTFHPRTSICDRPLQQHPQHNPIEVAVTLCSHEFTRKAVITAFEQCKQQFLGFYILDYNRCYANAEF